MTRILWPCVVGLLVGAGLLIQDFREHQYRDPGFFAGNVLVARLDLPETRYVENNQRATFYTRLVRRISLLPGVLAVGTSQALPFLNAHHVNFTIDLPTATIT